MQEDASEISSRGLRSGRLKFSPAALPANDLSGARVVIVSPGMVAFEWLHDCRHGSFKPVLQTFKSWIG